MKKAQLSDAIIEQAKDLETPMKLATQSSLGSYQIFRMRVRMFTSISKPTKNKTHILSKEEGEHVVGKSKGIVIS